MGSCQLWEVLDEFMLHLVGEVLITVQVPLQCYLGADCYQDLCRDIFVLSQEKPCRTE